MIVFRHLSWPEDRKSLLALDTSFTSDRIYRIEQTDRCFKLVDASVHELAHKSYPLADELDELESFDWVRVASDGEEIVGLAAMKLERWNRRANLHHLYLAPRVRRKGIGRTMVDAALVEARLRGARSLWVETQTINYGAIRFYERMSFEWCGVDTSLYDPAEVSDEEIALFFSRAVT